MRSKAEKRYINELSRELGKNTDIKRAFIADVASDIREYISTHAVADIQDLYDEFGTPAENAIRFTDIKDLSKLKNKARHYLVLKVIACIMLAVIIILVFNFIHIIKSSRGSHIEISNDFSTAVTESPETN